MGKKEKKGKRGGWDQELDHSLSLLKRNVMPFALLYLAFFEHCKGNPSAVSAGKTWEVFPLRLLIPAGLFALLFFF